MLLNFYVIDYSAAVAHLKGKTAFGNVLENNMSTSTSNEWKASFGTDCCIVKPRPHEVIHSLATVLKLVSWNSWLMVIIMSRQKLAVLAVGS